ncbi:MAG: hypothetical protein RI988_2789 [Pseudomonadota bacterium]|jgi:hypothetical protein
MKDRGMKRQSRSARWVRVGVPFLALLVGTTQAWAQFSAQGNVDTSASVVRTLSVTSTTELSFGTFSAGPTAGTLTMSAAGNRSATGGVTLVSTVPGGQAVVNLGGTPATGFSVSLPASVQLTPASGGASMTLSTFTTTLTGGQGSLNSSGTGSFGIGGTLTVAANQAIGTYSGSFTVTLNYN